MSSLVPAPGGVTRLIADVATERQIALTRGALGLALIVCCAWVLAMPYAVPRALALISLVFAALWVKRAIALLRSPASPGPQDFLELSHEGIAVREHGRELRLHWSEIAAVGIDQDRLTLTLLKHDGEIVHIEPRYRGITLEGLCQAASALHSSAETSGALAQRGG